MGLVEALVGLVETVAEMVVAEMEVAAVAMAAMAATAGPTGAPEETGSWCCSIHRDHLLN